MRRPDTQHPESPQGPARRRVLALLQRLPVGRVTTPEAIALACGVPAALVRTALSHLSEDERQIHPWHRVVASGGAIGRGPHREAQFARLVREGVAVSPAGIVQDMGRVLLTDVSGLPVPGREPARPADDAAPNSPPKGRSRGMKDRPGP